ncbi:MAG: UTP--glucose-1-phosphate uridylyltransferase, partial [Pseudomonadota bacterium]
MPFKPIKKAVFPVAGIGTRLLPATKVMPKEMLTIVDRPLIQMAVEEARAAGIEEFIFIINQDKDMLVQHFQDSQHLIDVLTERNKTELVNAVKTAQIPKNSFFTATQDKPLGLGHAVWCARHLVGDEPFAVILPDDTVLNDEGCLSQMMKAYNSVGGNIIATCAVSENDTSKYGILDIISSKGDMMEVRGLVEKPDPSEAPSNMAIFGRYILQPEIFSYLERHEKGVGGEIQLTDAMSHLIEDQNFHGFMFRGERLDCGSEIGFVKAQIAFALRKA